MRPLTLAPVLLIVASLVSTAAATEEPSADEHGIILTLPEQPSPHWLWVADRLFRHNVLFDGDTGQVLGMLDFTHGLSGAVPFASHNRREFYVLEPVYARGHRGERSDYVTIYDARTLEVRGEIEVPTRPAEAAHGIALAALLDGERFLVVMNQTPAASVSVIDLETRRFTAEIETAGCALVYPTGSHSFGMLCGNGTALQARLSADGETASFSRSEPFFSAVDTPLTEKGVRNGSSWLFASFDGYLHEVDFAADPPRLVSRWPLLTDKDRAAGWEVGGVQHLALHRKSGRLYSLVHKAGSGTHKDPGTEIWVYDLPSRERLAKIETPSLLPAFLRPLLSLERDGWAYRALRFLIPSSGVHSIVVSQDDEPLLFARHNEIGAIGVLDAISGKHLRDMEESGFGGGVIAIP